MSLPKNSKWLIERDIGGPKTTTDQKIKVTTTNGEEFIANYVGISNPSVFTGEIWTRETKVLSLKQHDHSTGYVAFHVAHRKGLTNDNEYVGRWHDNAGNAGGFRLTKF